MTDDVVLWRYSYISVNPNGERTLRRFKVIKAPDGSYKGYTEDEPVDKKEGELNG